jgi:hypothetical protein
VKRPIRWFAACPSAGSGHWRLEARALYDDLVGAVSEAVQRAVGEDGIVEEGHPFVHRAVYS